MPEYKLMYFDMRGRAEVLRYLFAVAGVSYEDRRVQPGEWPNLKPSTPYGHMPVLEVDGKRLSEGNAIARYLAREFGLNGDNSWENALCDQYLEVCADLFNDITRAYFERDQAKKDELMKTFFEQTCVRTMGFFERDMHISYLVGDKVTVADLAVLSVFDSLLLMKPSLMDSFPKLKSHRARLLALPKLKSYIENRKKTTT